MTGLEDRLGHAFRDPALLERALSHSSARGAASNERLEFLGDRVLGLILAERLHALYPSDPEGALALKFNALARASACAEAAAAAGLGPHLIIAASEGPQGRAKQAVLAGACEAVIAALYLDGGLDAARGFVLRYWEPMLVSLSSDMRDAKTALQEWAQGRSGNPAAPVYRETGRRGPDHAPHFTVEVSVPGVAPQTGTGGSKRDAEQDAAGTMLKTLGLRS